jgi:hypothetical protein
MIQKGHHFNRRNQSLSAQMGIPTGGSNVCMAQQFLDFIEAAACIDQKRGKAVPQIMHPKIGQASPNASSIPAVKK